MTERTITKEQLKTAIVKVPCINVTAFHAVIDAAFPPLFTPKKGEIIVVSDFKDFENSKIRMFSHMNVNSGRYECFMGGDLDETDTNTWIFVKPQTPTQKGE
jgi:hypothetical protein